MIPDYNQSGVLPPFVGDSPAATSGVSPYASNISKFVTRFGTSKERLIILRGLLEYRSDLRNIGVVEGVQWLDGSFVENVEANQGRPPNDIDLVTLAATPVANESDLKRFLYSNLDLFHPVMSKEKYFCDAYFVDLNQTPIHIVQQTRYWFGLFSHQRHTSLWKGLVEIPIDSDDDVAISLIEKGIENA